MVVPYILTATLFVMMFFDITALSHHSEFYGRERGVLLSFGVIVIAIFALIFLFYTNSFIIKQRKSELGLYNILGMEKKHISRTLCYETLLMGFISILLGIGIGILFGQAIFLALVKMVGALPDMSFEVPPTALMSTVVIFGFIFVCTTIYNISQIHLAKPIDLLKSKSTGEKEPKTKWILTIIGIVCIASGYTIAFVTKNPMEALSLFFVAVILVIIGTYCLFTAGSIALLKMMRKNKKYYYQTNHFVSVSNMIYRMKQNAVGLANICILSTMVLVMLASTGSLYMGIEDVVNLQARKDVNITFGSESYEINQNVNHQLMDYFDELHVQNLEKEYSFPLTMALENEKLLTKSNIDYDHLYYVYFTVNPNISLENNEIAYAFDDGTKLDSLTIENQQYKTIDLEKLLSEEDFNNIFTMNPGFKGVAYVVMKDEESIHHLFESLDLSDYGYVNPPSYVYQFDMDLNDELKEKIDTKFHQIVDSINNLDNVGGYSYSFNFKDDIRQSMYDLFGSFFFLGIFLSLLFMIATTLIMYYKQMSEGHEDVKRFEILQKVGMSHDEVKKSIHSQILIVFFMPLVAAGIHIMFAFNMIYQLFSAFGMTNKNLFALITMIVYVVFSVFYFIIYQLTARVYYKIVS